MSTELAFLRERLDEATAKLSGITTRKMFGCDTYFRDGTMFALVWKHGRIGVKLPDEKTYAELAAIGGAEPWSPGGKMVMGSWLLVPVRWNEDDEALASWVARAHALASGDKKKTRAKRR